MKKGSIALIIVFIIVLVGVVVVLTRGNDDTNTPNNPPPPVTAQNPPANIMPPPPPASPVPPPAAKPTPPGGTFSGEDDIMAPDVMVYDISYDGTKYTPSTLNIKQGDIVRFKNNSKDSFWPASAPHPEHTDYPEFDAKSALAAGKTFEFKFTKVGTWKFHDHIKPSAFGSITVTK